MAEQVDQLENDGFEEFEIDRAELSKDMLMDTESPGKVERKTIQLNGVVHFDS